MSTKKRRSIKTLERDFIEVAAFACTECVKPEKWGTFKKVMGNALRLYAELHRRRALETAEAEMKKLLRRLP